MGDLPKDPCTARAQDIVTGARRLEYGHPLDNFRDIAAGWSVLVGHPINPKLVPLMMDWLKSCRQKQSLRVTGRYHVDTNIDKCGYTLAAQIMEEEEDRRAASTKKKKDP